MILRIPKIMLVLNWQPEFYKTDFGFKTKGDRKAGWASINFGKRARVWIQWEA